MPRRMKLTLGGLAAGVLTIGLTTGVLMTPPLRAQPASPPLPMHDQPLPHDEMHRMMDAMHGEGTSARLHGSLSEDADRMLDQCGLMTPMMTGMMPMGRQVPNPLPRRTP